jgi:hypothetical protein
MPASSGKSITGIEMKATLAAGTCLLSLMLAACAAQDATAAPSFAQYAESSNPLKPGAKPKLRATQDREFKTRIAEASEQSVNFAGHYVLSSFGCGAGCVMSFALDKNSGKISWLPFTVCCWDDVEAGAQPLTFRKDSRLVVVTGSRNEQGKGVYYYEFKKERFILIREIER